MHSKARTPVSKLAKLMKRSAGSLRQKARNRSRSSTVTGARFVTVATDSAIPGRINLVILDGVHDFRSTFNTGPGRNWRASPFGATSGLMHRSIFGVADSDCRLYRRVRAVDAWNEIRLFSPFANINAVTTKQRGLFRTVLLVSKFQDRNVLLRAETEEMGNN
jgi:hypothetical protein